MSSLATAARELAVCENVTVSYTFGRSQVTALDAVDLAVRSGDAVALWGASGSGKTTLLHTLGGLLVPTAGTVRWKGEPLSDLDANARSRTRATGIAYVFQGSNLLPTFTAFENVSFAAWVSQRDDSASSLPPRELLELVGLGRKLDALPSELSGGEAQRVAIARAIAQSPQLLLCDEPTGHLDSDTAARVLDMLDALRERFGFAQVVATHDRGVAGRYSRLVALEDGRIAEDVQ